MYRTYYKRVYVEDDIPSFLKPEPPLANSRVPEMRLKGTFGDIRTERPEQGYQPPSLHPDFPTSEPSHFLEQRPLVDARFILRMAAILVALNALLYLWHLLEPGFANNRLSMQPEATYSGQQNTVVERRIDRLTARQPGW